MSDSWALFIYMVVSKLRRKFLHSSNTFLRMTEQLVDVCVIETILLKIRQRHAVVLVDKALVKFEEIINRLELLSVRNSLFYRLGYNPNKRIPFCNADCEKRVKPLVFARSEFNRPLREQAHHMLYLKQMPDMF